MMDLVLNTTKPSVQDRALTRTDSGEVEEIFLEDFGQSYRDLFSGGGRWGMWKCSVMSCISRV